MTSRNFEDGHLTDIRTIGFFSSSVGGPPHGAAIRFDTAATLLEINKLGFINSNISPTRYMDTNNDRSIYTNVVKRTDDGVFFTFCETKQRDFPQIEEAGNFSPLDLRDGQGLGRVTHCVAFKPGLIGAILANGPSASTLAGYIRKKRPIGSRRLQITPLVHRDVIARLNKFEAISLFQLKLSPSQLPVIRGAWDQLDNTFDSQLAMWNEQTALEVIVRPLESSQRGARASLIGPLTSLAQKVGMLPSSSTYKVRGKTEGHAREVTLNLLSDTLTTEEEIMKVRVRDEAVDDDSAFSAIIRAYEALKSEIEDAEGFNNR